MSTYLPEDVLIGILSRLPVKSLLRFRCVRKSWYALIRNPSFIEKHSNFMKNNNGSNDERFLVKRDLKGSGKPVVSLLNYRDGNETLDLLDLPVYEEELYELVVLGPINGMYVLYGRINGISVLLNPATRDFKALPVSTIPLAPHTSVLTDGVGLGFDPKTSDYKLVRIMERWRYDENDNVLPWDDERQHHLAQVEVYTLGTGSWRKIDAVVPNYNNDSPLVNSYLNGFYYWLLYDGGDAAMYSCDMGDEAFCKVPLPIGFSDLDIGHLAFFNESLALILYRPPEMEKCFDIWVMNKYGEEVSWTKQFTIGPLLGIWRPTGFGNNGALFLENSDGQLLVYEPDDQVVKDLRVHGMTNSFQVVIYMESLCWIKGGNEPERQNNSFEIIPDPFYPCKPCSGKNQTHSASS